ncbi:helix-turn-helix domain-containing protein [bacterium]|nr:helix-turn-helix domain-containing protein [bacterium]
MNNSIIHEPHMNKYPETGTKEMRHKIGEELRSARKYMQLSIEQVSIKTKINPRFIDSIEEGDWSFLPSTYIMAFIKSLSATVGLQSKIIDQYLEEMNSKNLSNIVSENSVGETVQSNGYAISGFTTWIEKNRSMVFFGAVAVVIVALIILYLTVPDRSSNRFLKQNDSIAEKAPETKSEPVISHLKTDTTKTTPEMVVDKAIPLVPTNDSATYSLFIYAEDTCYVKVEQTDSLLYERTLWPRNKVEVNPSEEIKISLGNAPGALLILEGDTLERFSEGRRVRVCRIDENGFVR